MPKKSAAGRNASARNSRRNRPTPQDQARSVISLSPHRKVGEINKRWFQREPIQHESNLEKCFVHSAMLCLGVQRITSQPLTFLLEGGERYTPDYELECGLNICINVEVKPAAKVGRYVATFNKAAAACGVLGKNFYVLTENNIHHLNRAAVAQRLLRYGKSELSEGRLHLLLAAGRLGPSTCEELMRVTGANEEEILHLLARRALVAQDEGHVLPQTRVAVASELDPIQAFERRFNVLPWRVVEQQVQQPRTRRSGLRKRPAPGAPVAPVAVQQLLDEKPPSLIGGVAFGVPALEEPYVMRAARRAADREGGH